MSKIVKALEKYKKERNLSSSQDFQSRSIAKATEPALKEGADRSAREGVDTDTAKESTQPYPPQEERIAVQVVDSREASQPQADRP